MLIEAQLARNLQVEMFEEATLDDLQEAVQDWLTARTEETLVGLEFESDSTKYRAYALYTE